MNTLVIHFSKFGNTQKVAEAIAERLSRNGAVRVISTDELKTPDLKGLDLLVIGTPTHRMNLPEDVRPVFERLPRRLLPKTPVAAFDTSYKMSPFLARFTAAKKLARKLRKLGGKRVVRPETFHVMEKEGPLYDGELERAEKWADTILKKLNE
jgi:flavodoxin